MQSPLPLGDILCISRLTQQYTRISARDLRPLHTSGHIRILSLCHLLGAGIQCLTRAGGRWNHASSQNYIVPSGGVLQGCFHRNHGRSCTGAPVAVQAQLRKIKATIAICCELQVLLNAFSQRERWMHSCSTKSMREEQDRMRRQLKMCPGRSCTGTTIRSSVWQIRQMSIVKLDRNGLHPNHVCRWEARYAAVADHVREHVCVQLYMCTEVYRKA